MAVTGCVFKSFKKKEGEISQNKLEKTERRNRRSLLLGRVKSRLGPPRLHEIDYLFDPLLIMWAFPDQTKAPTWRLTSLHPRRLS